MKQIDKDYSLTEVSTEGRRGAVSMFAIMLGFTFFSASMWTGGTLGISLAVPDFFKAILIGNLILGVYTSALGYIGAKTGLSTHLLARYSFGEKGSYLGSFLLALTQIGWFGVGVAMFVYPVSKVLNLPLYLLVGISGFLMTLTAYFGIKAVTILSAIAVPSIAILGGTSVLKAVDSVGGFEGLALIKTTDTIGIVTAISMCVGSFISGGSLTADFSRFAKSTKIGVLSTAIAFFLGNSLMFIFGAVGAKVFNTADISEVMFAQNLIIPAIIVLGFNIWTTNDNALYSSGLGFSNITKISKNKLVLINGFLGTLFALHLYNNFVGWLGLLNTLLPSIGAIIIADYFFVKKGNYDKIENMEFKSINWIAITSWALGVIAAKCIPGIAPLNSVLVSMISYYGLTKILIKNEELNYVN
ncbi:MAG: cytosine permease [Fusobacteriaceae bacterium]